MSPSYSCSIIESVYFLASSTVRSRLKESTTMISSAHRMLWRHRSMFFSSSSVITTTDNLSILLLHHQADQLVLHNDNSDNFLPVEMALHICVFQYDFFQNLLVGVDRHGNFRSHLAVHLDDHLHHVLGDLGCIVDRPVRVGKCFGVTEFFPEFFRDMRREGGHQQHKALHCLSRLDFRVEELIHEDHQLRDGGVEIEPLDVPGYLLDRLMEQLFLPGG